MTHKLADGHSPAFWFSSHKTRQIEAYGYTIKLHIVFFAIILSESVTVAAMSFLWKYVYGYGAAALVTGFLQLLDVNALWFYLLFIDSVKVPDFIANINDWVWYLLSSMCEAAILLQYWIWRVQVMDN